MDYKSIYLPDMMCRYVNTTTSRVFSDSWHPVQFSVHDSRRITAAIHRSQHIFSVEIDRMVFFPPLSSTQHAITTKSMLSYNHLCL